MTLSIDTYTSIIDHLKSQFFATGELWAVTAYANDYGIIGDYTSYKNRIDLFSSVLEEILRMKEARVGSKGEFLSGSPEEQDTQFKNAFPTTLEEMNEKAAYWWYLDECPGGLVWYTDIDDNEFETSPTGDGRFYLWT
ncbi:hypothetical protein CLV58_14034 [Spirosoma oryzae]|uniref:DUF596 domain-containing protein n=1 Tax=Spirosoma oryzae TaxID=1469603 RepID=A0A2T0RSF9_9BACT|nr:DUF596 domain-containing protein [Spirosoma oryzae]PRY24135.1 hypothetical protein CLV58_14034 [Spirosoma oryzae]